MMMRVLIHVVGDLHQPLHSSAFYSKDYPNSDFGGNLYRVQYQGKTQNWHKLWDAQFYLVENDMDRPYNETGMSILDA